MDFWKNVKEEKALALYNRGYDYLILDLGSGERGRKELLRCQEKIVIGSGLPWRIKDWSSYFRSMNGMGMTEDWHYLRLAGGDKGILSRQDGVRIHEIPCMEFLLKENEDWLTVRLKLPALEVHNTVLLRKGV